MKQSKLLGGLAASLLICASAQAGNYIGDYNVGDTIDCNFGTVNPSTGASFTLAGTPAVSAYIDNSTTELTAGITLTADFDSRTGLNHVRVVASGGNGYAAGTFVSLVITTGTVNSISVVGQEVCSFTLRKGTITGIPAATAGATGGLQIAGSNAATTYASLTVTGTTTLSDGLVVARSTSNQPAATFTGNGTGNGITVTSGAGATGTGLAIASGATNGAGLTVSGTGTGNGATITSGAGATGTGLAVSSAATNGAAVTLAGNGTGNGLTATGGATGHGISGVGGATSGNGIRATGTAGNSAALNLVGQGSAAGLLTTGGATGHGIAAVGGATSGSGISAIASTSGNGIVATGVGTTQAGIAATGGSTSSAGISATGGGTGSGILATSGAGATGNGITATAASTNGNGIAASGTGTGAGEIDTGGATGAGISYVGGATSGNAIATAYTAPLGAVKGLGILESGNMQASTSTTAVLRSATSFADTYLEGATIVLTGGTGAGQRRTCSGWTNSTDTCTVTAWATTPDTSTTYEVWGTASSTGGGGLDAAATRAALGMASANMDTQLALAARPLLTTGTAQAGAANTITLAAGASATDGLYDPGMIRILSGTGAGQARVITGYVGSTKVASVDRDWRTNPASDSVYEITPAENLISTNEGLAAGGAASTITLNSTASATDNFYNGSLIVLRSSTGQDQSRVITGYVGSTKVATVDTAWATNPASGSGYMVVPISRSWVATNNDKTGYTLSNAGIDAFADRAISGHTTGGTWGGTWNSAGSAGDPWSTALPGAYGAGTAGNIIGNRIDAAITSRLAPTVAARTLDVSAGGEAGLDWANIGSPTTSVSLTGTTVGTATTLTNAPSDSSGTTTLLSRVSATRAGYLDNLSAGPVATASALSALPNTIRDIQVEDMGGGVTSACVQAVLLSFAAGDIVTSGGSTTWKDPSNGETRITSTVTSAGNRTATITCPTLP